MSDKPIAPFLTDEMLGFKNDAGGQMSDSPLTDELIVEIDANWSSGEGWTILREHARKLEKSNAELRARLDAPLNRSAPEGHICADCGIDKEPCPVCYRVWWESKHPNTFMAFSDDTVVFRAQKRAERAEAIAIELKSHSRKKEDEIVGLIAGRDAAYERCAKVCECLFAGDSSVEIGYKCAAAIRALADAARKP